MKRVLAMDRSLFRQWIVSARRKRMTAQDTPQSEPSAFRDAVAFDGRMRIARATRVEAAARPQKRTQGPLIHANEAHQQRSHGPSIPARFFSNDPPNSREDRRGPRAAPPRVPRW